MRTGPVIVAPRAAPPPTYVLLPMGLGLCALTLAGIVLAVRGAGSGMAELAVVHLGLVAGLVPIASAAAVQLSAATTSTAHPRPRRLAALLLLENVGGALLAAGFALAAPWLLAAGGGMVWVGLGAALWAVAGRIRQSRTLRPLHLGLILGLAGLLGAASLGLAMAVRMALGPGGAFSLLPWHVGLAFGAGFGSLVAGVSWQLLPMFGRGRPTPDRVAYVAASLWAAFALLGAGFFDQGCAAAAWPLLALAIAQAAWTAWSLAGGKRRSLLPPYAGICHFFGALSVAAAVWALARGLPAQALILACGGYALMVLGYLERILPFLVFELSLQRRAVPRAVPKLHEILPPRGRAALLALFLAGLGSAGAWPEPGLRLFGLGLAALAGRLLACLRLVSRDASPR